MFSKDLVSNDAISATDSFYISTCPLPTVVPIPTADGSDNKEIK